MIYRGFRASKFHFYTHHELSDYLNHIGMCLNDYDKFTQCTYEAFRRLVICGGMGSPNNCKGPEGRKLYPRPPLEGKCRDCVTRHIVSQVRGKVEDPWGKDDPYRK